MGLGQNLTRLRERLGLDVLHAAERGKVPRDTWSDYEEDCANPTLKTLYKMAAGVDATIYELFTDPTHQIMWNAVLRLPLVTREKLAVSGPTAIFKTALELIHDCFPELQDWDALSRECAIPKKTLTDIWEGRETPGQSTIAKLARWTGLPYGFFIDGSLGVQWRTLQQVLELDAAQARLQLLLQTAHVPLDSLERLIRIALELQNVQTKKDGEP